MGRYIQGSAFGKAPMLMDEHGAEVICVNDAHKAFDDGMGVVCVVSNGFFEAAAYCYSKSEIEEFARHDGRPKTWLKMDKDLAEKLAV